MSIMQVFDHFLAVLFLHPSVPLVRHSRWRMPHNKPLREKEFYIKQILYSWFQLYYTTNKNSVLFVGRNLENCAAVIK